MGEVRDMWRVLRMGKEQERKFFIADFIATVGEDGTIQLPPQLLEVLGIDPRQSIHFEIDEKGDVTVKTYNPRAFPNS